MHDTSTAKTKPSLVVVQPGGVVWTGYPLLGTDLKVVRSSPQVKPPPLPLLAAGPSAHVAMVTSSLHFK